MKPLNQIRRFEVSTPEGWVPVHWEQHDIGDVVRIKPSVSEHDHNLNGNLYVVSVQPTLNVDIVGGAQPEAADGKEGSAPEVIDVPVEQVTDKPKRVRKPRDSK
ncbi:hypothetical protein [Enterococcus faecium]|uniref:hypothetical protein n=1 Tax=Enterococcus faecium TaxID=1352 RepID=UPI0025B0092A|nr:hypothetical protein [Enterococcus faecium]MDN3079997.1 hypothetical protein [Enterococcus faecium]